MCVGGRWVELGCLGTHVRFAALEPWPCWIMVLRSFNNHFYMSAVS